MQTTFTKQSTFTKQEETFNMLPSLIQKGLQKLWDNACENGILHKIYLEENNIDVSDSNNVSWNNLIGISDHSQITDYTSKEILAISNKAKKLAYKNDTMSVSKLRKIWVDTIRLEKVFVAKQTRLSGKEYIIMGVKWHDMIGMNKNFNYCSEKEILGMYEKARWYCEADLVRFECENCGYSYFYVDGEYDKDYLKTMWIKNKCHSLSGDYAGYGSKLDCCGEENPEKIRVNICDDCLVRMKS